jgi:hypothetical protein
MCLASPPPQQHLKRLCFHCHQASLLVIVLRVKQREFVERQRASERARFRDFLGHLVVDQQHVIRKHLSKLPCVVVLLSIIVSAMRGSATAAMPPEEDLRLAAAAERERERERVTCCDLIRENIRMMSQSTP